MGVSFRSHTGYAYDQELFRARNSLRQSRCGAHVANGDKAVSGTAPDAWTNHDGRGPRTHSRNPGRPFGHRPSASDGLRLMLLRLSRGILSLEPLPTLRVLLVDHVRSVDLHDL